jgi:hypothetical protein
MSDVAKLPRGRTNMRARTRAIVVLGLGLIVLAAGATAYKLRGVLVPAAEALTRGIPIAGPQELALADLPMGQGPRVSLFNGVDLNDWDGWLGYPDPAETFKKTHSVNPIGAGGIGKDFRVVVEEGEPAIYVNGKTFGSLTHKGDYADYHLSLQFKWGNTTYYPKLNDPQDSGLLYHSHGAPGGALGTWMRSVEFDIIHGQFGRLVTVGDRLSSKPRSGVMLTCSIHDGDTWSGGAKLKSPACHGLPRTLLIRKSRWAIGIRLTFMFWATRQFM